MRDEKWLFQKLDEIWDKYFPDVPQDNEVQIIWGRQARTRLGSIRQLPQQSQKLSNFNYQLSKKPQLKNSKINKLNKNLKFKIENSKGHPTTLITINSLFKDENIPDYVVVGTIAHELAHYAHGFHSPLEQKFATPHAGGIIHQEFSERGLESIHKKQKKWLKENWREYIKEKLPAPKPRKRRRIIIKWI